MTIDNQEVSHVADLARLAFDEKEKDLLVAQLNTILDYFKKLQEIDTHEVIPTSQVVDITNVFRPDEVREVFDRDTMLTNAPSQEHHYFKVPQVIDEH